MEKLKWLNLLRYPFPVNLSSQEQNRDFDFASVSVLASGDWYKIGVETDGIHRLNYSDLSDLGIPVASVNPSSINIYGNHTPEISHSNWEKRQDDLVKNAILISGEGDGSFDESDYILFYAKGPENLKRTASDFNPRKNKIDSLAYYFIHIDNSDAPKRVGTISNSASPFTNDVVSYNAYALYEDNDVNLLKSGDGWYGKHFQGSSLTESFSINAENRETTEPVTLKTTYVSASKSGSSGT